MSEQSNKFLIPIAIIIAGGLIGWGIVVTNKKDVPNSNQNDSLIESSQSGKPIANQEISIQETDYILGNPEAELVFFSFNDFECPFCAIFHQTMHQIINEYGKSGQVAWIFRQFPIYGAGAEKKAIAAKCAGQLGGNAKIWELSDKISQFNFTENKETITKQLSEIAEEAGLDKKQFEKCLNDDTVLTLIKEEYQSGIDTGVLGTATVPGGTPYTIILTKMGKTYPISGAQPYNVIKSIIDLILREN